MSHLHIDLLATLSTMLKELYGFRFIADLQPILGGYTTQNFSFSDEEALFFLKRYNTLDTARMHTIAMAHQRLTSGNIPIVLPLMTHRHELAFFLDEAWWGVFPFVQGRTYHSSELTPALAHELGLILGHIHIKGLASRKDDIEPIMLWNKDVFTSDQVALEYVYEHQKNKREVDTIAISNIRLQAEFVATHSLTVSDLHQENNCLIHGDFTHNNVFFDEHGHVKWIFDLDKACVAPRAYELARSVLITCFDHGWDEKSFQLADEFLRSYLRVYPMGFDEFKLGFQIYITYFMHTTWLEKKVILYQSEHHEPFIFTSHRRLLHLLEDFDTLAERLYPTSGDDIW